MKALMVLGLLVLSSCGRSGQDAQFLPYIEQWRADAATHQVSQSSIDLSRVLPVYFVPSLESNGQVIGATCFNDIFSGPRVQVSKKAWDNLQFDGEKTTMIYHELGHCIFGKSHSTDPADIMFINSASSAFSLMSNPGLVLQRYFFLGEQ